VGIEHMYSGAQGERTLLWVLKGIPESLRILRSSARRALSICTDCVREELHCEFRQEDQNR
jgi:hypothetical protein